MNDSTFCPTTELLNYAALASHTLTEALSTARYSLIHARAYYNALSSLPEPSGIAERYTHWIRLETARREMRDATAELERMERKEL